MKMNMAVGVGVGGVLKETPLYIGVCIRGSVHSPLLHL